MPAFLKIKGPGIVELVDEPLPFLPADRILVKVHAVALNNTDWKHVYYEPARGSTVGCDYAGEVVAVGSAVTSRAPGDRVAGFTHGSNAVNADDGAFGEYAVVIPEGSLVIPEGMSYETAATLGVALVTSGQTLFDVLQLPRPDAVAAAIPFPILVLGGSTATGTMAIQFAKLAGVRVVATASPRNFELVRGYGADEVVDYRDPNLVSTIRDLTDNSLRYILNCVSTSDTQNLSSDLIGPLGGTVVCLTAERPDATKARKDIRWEYYMAYGSLGEYYTMSGKSQPSDPGARGRIAPFLELCQKLIETGKLKSHPIRMLPNGLAGIEDGLRELKDGKVSAEKLVGRVAETPVLA